MAPYGTGHFYAGYARRARGWLGGLILGLVLLAVLLLALPGSLGGVAAVAVLVVFALLSVLGPAWDLLRLPLKDRRQPALGHVVAFGVVSFALFTAIKRGVQATLTENFKIASGSMAPTLEAQDHVMVDKWHYGPVMPLTGRRIFAALPPQRGDLVLFEYPETASSDTQLHFVKRVIAVGGDTLEVHYGHPIVNGWKVPSCQIGKHTIQDIERAASGELFVEFLGSQSYLVFIEDTDLAGREHQGPYRVAAGEAWVLGDNRHNAADSRSWNDWRGKGLAEAQLKGRASFVWLGFTPEDAEVDWARIGLNLLEPPRPPRNASPEVRAGLERCLASRPAQTLPPAGTGVLARQ